MKKNILFCMLIVASFIACTLQATKINLIGIGNYFQALSTNAGAEMPVVTIAKDPNQMGVPVPAVPFQGGLSVKNLELPVYVNVKYTDKPLYKITLQEEVTNKLPCSQSATATTVGATVSPGQANTQRICVPLSVGGLPTSVTPIKSGDFNNVALLLGPLTTAQAKASDPTGATSLPFSFGLMAWTSLNDIWKNSKLSQTPDGKAIKFSKPLRVYQGFAALGGGPIPRQYFSSIAHIYNDSPNTLVISRDAGKEPLNIFDVTQIIPPYSIFPYALLWIPKVANEAQLALPRHSGIRIVALVKGETAQAPDSIDQSEIEDTDSSDTSTDSSIDYFADYDQLASQVTSQITPNAGNLLGITDWTTQIKSSYKDFKPSKNVNYYSIATTEDEKATFVQKCPWGNKVCKTVSALTTPLAYTKTGIPTFYSLVIKGNENTPLTTSLYPITLESPK
ncbi:hypothetical protein H0X48_02065 [Candidatus Dependentiae bacterium]|nr:hypothetical protein [Candidatus Dependentiae bacterium]